MTKDLAIITTIENPKVLDSFEFIKAIRTRLENICRIDDNRKLDIIMNHRIKKA